MNYEIIESPLRLHLHGISGEVHNDKYGETGLRLMNEMWQAVKTAKVLNTGINHWVYLPHNIMFTGVALTSTHSPIPGQLESMEFELHRYLRHLHVGPYEELFQKWNELKAILTSLGEKIASPSLEIYGHHCDDKSRLETTILINLAMR